MSKKLTSIAIDKIKPHPDKRIEIADAGKPGLYLVIQPNGRKSWAIRYRRPSDGAPRKLTLAGFPSLGLAHRLAQSALDRVAEGHDPAREKQVEEAKRRAGEPDSDSVEGMFREFLDRHTRRKDKKPIRERTRQATARFLGFKRDPAHPDKWITAGKGAAKQWAGRAIKDIKAQNVRDLLDAIADTAGPVAANRALTALKTAFRWRVDRDNETFPKSPCDGVKAPSPEEARTRVLTDREIAALWRVADADGYPFGPMVQMLILTGCRRDEVRGARWVEFDLPARTWSIPGARTKNGRDHLMPLSDATMAILAALPHIKGNSGLLFTTNGLGIIGGLGRAKDRLDEAMAGDLGAAPEHWVFHDLRRTFVTGLQRLGIALEVAEACVNHRSGTLAGVTAVYAQYDYAAEKRAALDAWARHVEAIVSGKPGSVVPFKGKASRG